MSVIILSPMEDIPGDLFDCFLRFLPYSDVVAVRGTCRRVRDRVSSTRGFRRLERLAELCLACKDDAGTREAVRELLVENRDLRLLVRCQRGLDTDGYRVLLRHLVDVGGREVYPHAVRPDDPCYDVSLLQLADGRGSLLDETQRIAWVDAILEDGRKTWGGARIDDIIHESIRKTILSRSTRVMVHLLEKENRSTSECDGVLMGHLEMAASEGRVEAIEEFEKRFILAGLGLQPLLMCEILVVDKSAREKVTDGHWKIVQHVLDRGSAARYVIHWLMDGADPGEFRD